MEEWAVIEKDVEVTRKHVTGIRIRIRREREMETGRHEKNEWVARGRLREDGVCRAWRHEKVRRE